MISAEFDLDSSSAVAMMLTIRKAFNRAIGILVMLLIANNSSVAQTIAIDKVLAIVNDHAITQSEYRTRHRQERFENSNLPPFDGTVDVGILDSIIDEHIQTNQAKLRKLTVSEKEIDNAVSFIAQQNNLTVEALVEQLESDDFTYTQFRESLRRQQLIRKLIDAVANSRVVISDREVDDYIKSHSELQNTDESYEVSHLFVQTAGKTEEQLDAEIENMDFIRESIIRGQNFSEAVKNFGDGDNSEGGYLGWRKVDELPELFIKALRELDPDSNNISPVLTSQNGLHILKLHGRQGSGRLVHQQLIQHILISPDQLNSVEDAEKKAFEIYQQLQQGESFEKLARLYSQDQQSRNEGGSMGWISPGVTVPRFEDAAKALTLNVASKPVQTRFGFHIIKVIDRREADMSNELASNQARQAIFRRKSAELFKSWFRNVRQRAFIEYVGIE